MEQITLFSEREQYVPSRFTLFLWWLSTAEKELLNDAVVDRNRHRIIGMTVLGTWLFATFTWTYFFSTVTNSAWTYIPCGLFLGFIILVIDRALIKGISKTNKTKTFPLVFRGLLALTIGTFMAQPAILFIFKKDIKTQMAFDNEQKKLLNKKDLDFFYSEQLALQNSQKEDLQSDLNKKYEEVSRARENFISETDGSGGTGKIGIKDIALAKKAEYEKLDAEYKQLLIVNRAKIDSAEAAIASINRDIITGRQNFNASLDEGFLTQIEALSNLIKKNSALEWRYYLVVFIFMLIELMPVLAKSMLPSGTYDEKARLREEMEMELARRKSKRQLELLDTFDESAFNADKSTIDSFFKEPYSTRKEKDLRFSS